MEIPFLLSREAQDARAESRGGEVGIQTVDVSFTGITANKPYKIFGGHHYGFSIISFSTGQSDVTIFTARPRSGITGQTARVGLTVRAKSETPISGEIWVTKGAAAAGVTMRIAIFLRPGEIDQFQNMVLYGPDGTAAEVRNADADADFAAALGGLVTNTRLSAFDTNSADWGRVSMVRPDLEHGELHNAWQGLRSNSVNFGRDTGDNTLRAVEARNADADGDFSSTLYGLLVNARLTGFVSGGDFSRINANTVSGETGVGHASRVGLNTLSTVFGRDTGDNTIRAIEADVSGTTTQAATLYRLLTDAAMRVYDPNPATFQVQSGVEEFASQGHAFGAVVQGRQAGFYACRRARRYRATDEGASVTCSNGFTATAPRFTLEPASGVELIVKKIVISVLAAGTTNFRYRVILDPDARYSSGGTAGTAGARINMNGGSATAASSGFHYGSITATATDADEREVETGTIVNVTGNRVEINFEDGLIVDDNGTLLIYIYDAGATGTAHIMVEFEEANLF